MCGHEQTFGNYCIMKDTGSVCACLKVSERDNNSRIKDEQYDFSHGGHSNNEIESGQEVS